MKNLYITMTFTVIAALLVIVLAGCGEEAESITQPTTTTPKSEPPVVSQPPVAEMPAVPEGVVFFEAEEFAPNKSVTENGAVKWHVKDDPAALGGKYITPTGANRKGDTELVYPIPEITLRSKEWKLWMRVIFPRAGGEAADSFFWDLSLDGKKWLGPQEIIAGEAVPDWQWRGWKMEPGPDKGDGNWFKLLERESDIQIDVICLRADGEIPDDEQYKAYLKAVNGGE